MLQLSLLESADAEALPIHQAMRELLDATEGVTDVDVGRHDLLHREDLVQLFGGDRFLEDSLQ